MVISIIEDLQKDYYVNEREYFSFIPDIENLIISEEWTNKWIYVDKRIKYLFKFNSFLNRLLFDSNYKGVIEDNSFGDYDRWDFSHSQTIRVNEEVCDVAYSDTITGVLSFPYMNWDEVGEWINKCSEDWSVYIMNPALVNYNFGAVGLFLTPTFYNGISIKLFNNYVIKLTGYPLFLKYTNEDKVDKINNIDLSKLLTKEAFVEELSLKAEDEAFKRLVDFWCKNNCVICKELDDAYYNYLNAQPYRMFNYSINFKKIQSLIPFRIVNPFNKEELGLFKSFMLDKAYKDIITHDGRLTLTNEQLEEFMLGRYYFKLNEDCVE